MRKASHLNFLKKVFDNMSSFWNGTEVTEGPQGRPSKVSLGLQFLFHITPSKFRRDGTAICPPAKYWWTSRIELKYPFLKVLILFMVVVVVVGKRIVMMCRWASLVRGGGEIQSDRAPRAGPRSVRGLVGFYLTSVFLTLTTVVFVERFFVFFCCCKICSFIVVRFVVFVGTVLLL